MRVSTSIAVAALLVGNPPGARGRAWESDAPRGRVAVNDNRTPAGVVARGVLTMKLEVREGEWNPDAESAPGLVVHAFAEEGKATLARGPLVREPQGTEICATVRNTLSRDTVVIRGLSTRGVTGSVDALRNLPLDGTPIPAEHHQPVTNHSTDMMGGLVMGITVRGRDTSTQSRAIPQRR